MKKWLSILLAGMLVLSLTACAAAPSASEPAAPTEPAAEEPTKAEPLPAATTFPKERAIKIVVPYSAGGGVDISSRLVSSTATETLDQRIDVVCMDGANGQEAIQFVYNQPSDGYTILATDYGPFISPVLQGEVDTYSLDEWVPIIDMNDVTPVFFVKSDSPYETMNDLIAAATETPGTITVGHGRYMSVPHLPLILLEAKSGASFSHVATSGGSEALAFVLGGNVDVGASVPSTIASSVKSGDLRALAVAAEERLEVFPDTPTLKELGYDVVMPAWYMLFVKADTPQDVRDTLEAGFMQALDSPTAQKMASTSSIDLANLNSADSMVAYQRTIENLTEIFSMVTE
ncbi:MAG: tripartite tricarboxylate transporter substrate binding protein [Candidatus Pelethousia sp.]|nr:tripartite tricarboxylate transporter substrate binding protein [Candidatus Pelethousia sp.]